MSALNLFYHSSPASDVVIIFCTYLFLLQYSLIAQAEHPQEQELLPFFLLRILFTIIVANTAATINATIIVGRFHSITSP